MQYSKLLIIQGFWCFAQLRSREIHKNTQNTVKFGRNLIKYMSVQQFWNLSQLLGVFTCRKLTNLWTTFRNYQASVVQRLDSAIHRINLYPVDSAIGFPNTWFIRWIALSNVLTTQAWCRLCGEKLGTRNDVKGLAIGSFLVCIVVERASDVLC